MIRIKKFYESIESEQAIKEISEKFMRESAEATIEQFNHLVWNYDENLEELLLSDREEGVTIEVPLYAVRFPKFLRDFYENHFNTFLYSGF